LPKKENPNYKLEIVELKIVNVSGYIHLSLPEIKNKNKNYVQIKHILKTC